MLSADLRKWDVAYGIIRETARRALGKGSARLKDGEVTACNENNIFNVVASAPRRLNVLGIGRSS